MRKANDRTVQCAVVARDRKNASGQRHAQGEPLCTVPNVLTGVRLVGSAALVGLAWAGLPQAFLLLFLALAVTDWVDGKLAIWLGQRTTLGARLDSAADVTLYAVLLLGAAWLCPAVLTAEWGWIAAAVCSYAVSALASLMRFGRWPSYHTRSAKTSWLLVTIATAAVLTGWPVWSLRLAMALVTVANLEATFITWILPAWRTDVATLYHAWRLAKGADQQR